MRKNILDLHPDELKHYFYQLGEKKYRSKQTLDWIYRKNVPDIDRMTTLTQELRSKLKNEFNNFVPRIERKLDSFDGSAKYLLSLEDNNVIEMVLMPGNGKNTLCLSSQVGCKRNCQFCATAKMGFIRNLTVSEINAQVLLANRELFPKRLTNLVFMGMGEPLDNLDHIMKSIKILQHQDGMSFSPRRITISTCGIIPGIVDLTKSGLKLKLAVSLNSAIQVKREKLMPIARTYPLDHLKSVLHDFRKINPYRITFEYILIKNFNMSSGDIKALRSFLGDISCKLNLIRFNKIPNSNFETPEEEEIKVFIAKLKNMKVAITLRDSRGNDIQAACGQLAGRKY